MHIQRVKILNPHEVSEGIISKYETNSNIKCSNDSNNVFGLVSPRSRFDHSNLDHSVLFRMYPVRILRANFVLRI